MSYVVVLVIAPPGSPIDGMAKLKGHSIGVIAEETNSRILDVLSKEYGLVRARVSRILHWQTPDMRFNQSRSARSLL